MQIQAPIDHSAYPPDDLRDILRRTRIIAVVGAETVTSDPLDRPVLLRTEMAAGHGGRSGRYAAWEQIAWEWAFVLDQLGATGRVDGSPDAGGMPSAGEPRQGLNPSAATDVSG